MKSLPRECELELIALAKAGDKQAQSALLQQFHFMLWRFATSTRTRTEMADDLYQEAAIAFLQSIDRFDLKANVRLTTYLYARIPHILKRIADEDGLIRVSKNRHNRRIPTTIERAAKARNIQPFTDDIPLRSDPGSEDRDALYEQIDQLSERQALIIRDRLEGKTLRAIGLKLGFTAEYIRQVEEVAIETLRQRMTAVLNPIAKTPGVCGGDARISGTRIPVWSIEQCRRLGMSVQGILDNYPSLDRESILSAWEYAGMNQEEIDDQIRENVDAD